MNIARIRNRSPILDSSSKQNIKSNSFRPFYFEVFVKAATVGLVF